MTEGNRGTRTFGPGDWAERQRAYNDDGLDGRIFTENMTIYSGGGLGVRDLWEASFEDTATKTVAYATTGQFSNNGSIIDVVVTTGSLGFVCYIANSGTIVAQESTPNGTAIVDRLDKYYWVAGRYLYYLRVDTAGSIPRTITRTLLDLETPFGETLFTGRGAVLYEGRAYYWGAMAESATDPVGVKSRLYYSDLYDFGTFSAATQYIEVDGEVDGAFALGQTLHIYTFSGQWYKFDLNNAGDPADGYLVAQGFDRTPDSHRSISIVDEVAFFGANDKIVAYSKKGLDDRSLADIELVREIEASWFEAAGDSSLNAVHLPYYSPELSTLNRTHAWSFSDAEWRFESVTDTTSLFTGVAWYGAAGDRLWRIKYTNANDGLAVYSRRPHNDRPAYHPEEEYVAGVLTDQDAFGKVWLGRLSGESHQYVRVNKVTIDAAYWKITSYTMPQVAITVTVVDQTGTEYTLASDFSYAALADSDVNGFLEYYPKYTRIHASAVGLPFTPFCEVRLNGISQMALEFVHVDYEVEDRKWL